MIPSAASLQVRSQKSEVFMNGGLGRLQMVIYFRHAVPVYLLMEPLAKLKVK